MTISELEINIFRSIDKERKYCRLLFSQKKKIKFCYKNLIL